MTAVLGDRGTVRAGLKDQSVEKKDKIGIIVPLHSLRFPFFLEFHKQMQSCAAFHAQADVFVAFSSVEELERYWEAFRKPSTWRIPLEWESWSSEQNFTTHGKSTTADRSIPSCMNSTAVAKTHVCEESGITSVVVPQEQFSGDVDGHNVWRTKKYWLAAWVLSKQPGYRFLALPDSELRITDCKVFEKQSLLAAIEESYARKRWTGCFFPGSTCPIQVASAAAVTTTDAEFTSLESRGATCAYTGNTEFPWVEVMSFTDMIRAIALKHGVGPQENRNILELVEGLHQNRTYKKEKVWSSTHGQNHPNSNIMYQMWMVLKHQFRVVRRKMPDIYYNKHVAHVEYSNFCCALSESTAPPEKMDWAPMWARMGWCGTYNPPSSRKPFFFFDLDKAGGGGGKPCFRDR
jgi:hypothetical protein